MRQKKQPENQQHTASFYSMHTQPVTFSNTAPLPPLHLPAESRWRSFGHSCKQFGVALVRKINQMLGLALLVTFLLLGGRFVLTGFHLQRHPSLFVQWMYLCSDPLALPFQNVLPHTRYQGFLIDGSLILAIVVYCILALILRRFLTLLITEPR
uniref:YggT family protein n=1 Tax=Thermosporothrix sp. COM3 TaxID=2490863 RepID=A0A455SM79_9CHLR|nr:hypothetical protein KTC_42280 [Thermosporothrix sp. COM3]